jgi:hypothetical protein
MKLHLMFSASLLLVLSACGGSTTSAPTGGAGASGPTATEACAALEKARCEKLDACSNNLGTKSRYGDQATCESRSALSCVSALSAPQTSSTPTSVEACAVGISSESCEDFLDNSPAAACIPAAGGLAAGAACGANAQCQSTFCKVDKGAVCGVCAAEPVPGDTCDVTADCGRALLCAKDPAAASGVCAIPVAKDGACDKAHPCAATLSCVGAMAMSMTMGKCQPAGDKVGAMCDPQKKALAACEANLGLYCAPATNTCQEVQYVAAGQPCGVLGMGMALSVASCTAGATCVIPGGTGKAGTCVAPAADGAACDTAAGPSCMAPAKCVLSSAMGTAGTCKVPDASTCM